MSPRADLKLHRLYLRLNRRWFSNRLPRTLTIMWDASLQAQGLAGQYREPGDFGATATILLNPYYKGWDNLIEFTLLHEMVHALIPNDDESANHGPRFQREMLRLARLGAFAKVW